jgi:PAS domain S-box-containing protein
MVSIHPRLQMSAERLILNDLADRIAHLPEKDRAPIQEDIQRLQNYLDANEQVLRESERLRQESDERFQILADSSPLLIWMTDPQGGNHFINQTYRDFIGVSPEEVLDIHWQSYFHPDDAPAYVEAFQQALREQKEFYCEARVRRADGAWRWLASYARPRFANDGTFLGEVGSSMDITSRKQAEEDLRKSEMIYRAIGEAIDYGIWICEPDGRNTYASQSFLELLGITQQECSDFGWGDTLHPEDSERTIAAWKECVRTGGTWDIEHRFRGKDGLYHPILARGVPVRNERGEIICWAGINLDINRLKQSEQALRESEGRFRVALSSLPMTVYILDRDLRYTWIYHSPLGLTPPQVLGKRDEEIFPAEAAAEMTAIKQAVIDSGQSLQKEVQLFFNGETRYFLLSLEPLHDSSGAVTGLIGASLDMTEQKRIEIERTNALTQTEVQRQLLENREQERQEIARELHDGPIQLLSATIFHLQVSKDAVQDPLLKLDLDQAALTLKGAIRELLVV